MTGEEHLCSNRSPGWPSLLCNLVPGHGGDHRARWRAGEIRTWPQDAPVVAMPHRSGDLTNVRRDRTEQACAWLGAVLVEYVTGDYASDDIAEMIGQAAAAQIARHGDTEDEVRTAVVRALRLLAAAVNRMADDSENVSDFPRLLNPGSTR